MSSTKATASASVTPAGAMQTQDQGKAQEQEGITIETFLASLSVAAIVFGVQVALFILIRQKLKRVYTPRTYLVPEKRRTPLPPQGLVNWFKPIFNTASSDFINKSGLDAYFFLRYLLMLVKVFCVVAIIILPILLPLNYVNGRGGEDVKGLDRFAWTNVGQNQTRRYWAHLILAITLIICLCYTFYDEMRKYIRLRQAYLTNPQHRLKASATTVLVSGIPKSWLTVQRLVELYDAFPGGIRNIWINRDYDDLQEKVDERDKLARTLEKAETELIVLAKKSYLKMAKKEGKKHVGEAEDIAAGPGLSSGNPHQISEYVRPSVHGKPKKSGSGFGKAVESIPVVGTGIGKVKGGVLGGIGAVTGGVRKLAGSSDRHASEAEGFHSGPEGETHPALREPEHQTHPALRSENSHGSDSSNKRGSTLIGVDVNRRTSRNIPEPIRTDAPSDEKKVPSRKKTSLFDKHRRGEDDETPLSHRSPTSPELPQAIEDIKGKIFKPKSKEEYLPAYNQQYDGEEWGDPVWKKYVRPKDRPTVRLPLLSFLPSLPLIGKKVDTITYCRKELARLNLEIEEDQRAPERYPLMNSAFIQFNQQVAAHMACQAVSHHVPQHMAPRYIEVSPNDVVWGNMKMQWWERYIRVAGITVATGGLIIGWAFPVAFVGLISQIKYLTNTFKWLDWLNDLPDKALGIVQGILPPLFLAILMAVLPMILRLFARLQGAHTGMSIERTVQGMYFAFLFIQVFLVVSISSGITAVADEIWRNPTKAPEILAKNLPKASNFFFSYLLLQGFSVGGGALLQIATLLINFILAPIVDKTAREKFVRTTSLQEVKWGTFFPVYTNLACIGIIYSVISPLILVFNILTFSLFWVVYRYNLLFVVNFRFDTGGLLFPRAINQLFTGIYVMEVCLIGLFFLVRDSQGNVACAPQAIICVVVLILTVLFQFTFSRAFDPLTMYLPITLEDDAAARDEEFAKQQAERRNRKLVAHEQQGDNLNRLLADKERAESAGIELRSLPPADTSSKDPEKPTVAPPDRPELTLFQDVADEIEDLSPEERDELVAVAFKHPALRAKRPAIWIPRDELGVSDDEIRRTQKLTDKIWVSNEYAAIDSKGKVMFRRQPPDFDLMDLVEL